MPIIDAATGSETLIYSDGLIDVYGDGKCSVLLTVRREPRDIYQTRNVQMSAEDARNVAIALLHATKPEGFQP